MTNTGPLTLSISPIPLRQHWNQNRLAVKVVGGTDPAYACHPLAPPECRKLKPYTILCGQLTVVMSRRGKNLFLFTATAFTSRPFPKLLHECGKHTLQQGFSLQLHYIPVFLFCPGDWFSSVYSLSNFHFMVPQHAFPQTFFRHARTRLLLWKISVREL